MSRERLSTRLASGLLVALASPAAAEPVAFTARVGDRLLTSTVDLIVHGGVYYVPLTSLVEQFGGTCSTTPNQIQINLWGESARIDLDDTRVQAQAGALALGHPARQLERGPAIARSDVAPLFKAAFAMIVTETATAQRPVAPQPIQAAPRTAPSTPVAQPPANCIIIDPGHGGDDTGWVARGPIAEKSIAVGIATQLASALQGKCETVLTRTDDVALDINDRVSVANAKRGTAFVSIHAGASVSDSASGFEVFAPPPRTSGTAYPDAEVSLVLARRLEANVARTTGVERHGIRQAPCRVFRDLRMPGVLIEVGYMTNETDLQRVNSADYQARLAQGIADGLLEFMAAQSAR
jgi:N-acetylmuramoyl-L-alanine amidase